MSKPHSFLPWATCCRGIPYCAKCGLLWLSNNATRKAIKKACPGADDDK